MAETAISDQEFALFQRLIHRIAGINLADSKKVLLVGRLQKRLRHYGLDSFGRYYRLLADGEHPEELQTMVDLLTTNETYFFREPKHFDFLRDEVLPGRRPGAPFRVWSAASSTGEEAYTLAMLLPWGSRDYWILMTIVVVLRGNLAPRGAIIKPSAATPELLVHTGRAVVFEDADDLHRRIDDENLDIDETCVMVLKHCGPKGYPGMSESGNMPLPPKVLRKGITDMVRISDARMSGTAYGTVVLHTSPEAAAGGPLAVVKNGDMIELNVPERRLHLEISEAELQSRLAQWSPPAPPLNSGYWKLYIDHVLQADEGADLDFLVGQRGAFVPKDNH